MRSHSSLWHDWSAQVRALAPSARKSQTTVLSLFVLGVVEATAVTASRVAAAIAPPEVQVESTARRFRRMLGNPAFDPGTIWTEPLTALLARWRGQRVTLVFDPTPLGKAWTGLVLSIVWQGRALPVAWLAVPQQAPWPRSEAAMLEEVLGQVAAALPEVKGVTVLLDRGLSGPGIVDAVGKFGFDVVLRLRAGEQDALRVRRADGSVCRIGEVVTGPGQHHRERVAIFKGAGWREGWLTIRWDVAHGEPLVLFSTRPGGPWRAAEYRKRMTVEATYGDLKSRGFNLEGTRLVQAERWERLLVGVALALWWMFVLGRHAERRGLRPKFARADRQAMATWRLGWLWMRWLRAVGERVPLVCKRSPSGWLLSVPL